MPDIIPQPAPPKPQPRQLSASQLTTLQLMSSDGIRRVPVDSLGGDVHRSMLTSTGDGRVATLERFFSYYIDNVPDPQAAFIADPNFDNTLRQQLDILAAQNLREQTVAQYPWSIEAGSRQGVDKQFAGAVAIYVQDVLSRLDMVSLYEIMQQVVLDGGVGVEFTWHRFANGVQIPVDFNEVKRQNFRFDRLGNMAILTRSAPVWGDYVQGNPGIMPKLAPGSQEGIAVYAPHGKFMYHKYKARGGTWQFPAEEGFLYWGRGENVNLYKTVVAAQWALGNWLVTQDRWGRPPVDLYVPNNEFASAQTQRVVRNIRNDWLSIFPRIPGGAYDSMYHVEMRQGPPAVSFDAFHNFLDYIGKKFRSVLLGSADEQEKGEGGGYSDHVSRHDTGGAVLFGRDAKKISWTLGRELIPFICLGRWPNIPAAYFPTHVIGSKEERDIKQDIEVLEAIGQHVPTKISTWYETAQVEEPSADDLAQNRTVQASAPPTDDPFAAMLGAQPKTPIGQPKPKGETTLHQGGAPKPTAPIGQGSGSGDGSVAQKGIEPVKPAAD